MGIEPSLAKKKRHCLYGFLWSFAEGTFFFVVPDVLISRVALFSLKGFIVSALFALWGSLCAGVLMYALSFYFPASTENFVRHVPFIPDALLATVRDQYARQGVWALLNGPLSGTPYKIYAIMAPGNTSLLPFLLVSIPVRLARFLVVGGVAALVAHFCRRHAPAQEKFLPYAHAACWCIFYAFYWSRMGW